MRAISIRTRTASAARDELVGSANWQWHHFSLHISFLLIATWHYLWFLVPLFSQTFSVSFSGSLSFSLSLLSAVNYFPFPPSSHGVYSTHTEGLGMLGTKGDAYTLITRKETNFAVALVHNMSQASQYIPPSLSELAQSVSVFARLSVCVFQHFMGA